MTRKPFPGPGALAPVRKTRAQGRRGEAAQPSCRAALAAPLPFAADGKANFSLGFWPDATARPKAINNPTIPRADHADAMRRQTSFGHQRFHFREEIVFHAEHITRTCVHINTRKGVRAHFARQC